SSCSVAHPSPPSFPTRRSSDLRIESYFLDGAAGKIEALLEEPEWGEPREACLVCHPHPLYGGTMHNKVVYRMARALRRSGSVVRSEEHTSELQSRENLVCRLLL